MNKYTAATILKNTLEKTPESFTEEGKEAIEEGILLLYKEHIKLTGAGEYLAIRCTRCHKPIFINAYKRDFGGPDEECVEYTGKCPNCEKEYIWNNCYWR